MEQVAESMRASEETLRDIILREKELGGVEASTLIKGISEGSVKSMQDRITALEQEKSSLTAAKSTLETELQGARATMDSVNQQNNVLTLAKTGLEGRLRDEQAKTGALEQDKTGLTTSNDTLEAKVRDIEQQLTDEKTSSDGLVSTVNQNKATIERLTSAVQYQVATFANQAADSQDVEKIVELLAKPQSSVSTPTRVVPTLIFNRTSIRTQSASAPYLLWVASRHGSLDEVLEHAQEVFNVASTSHAAQVWWVVDALERLASQIASSTTIGDIKVVMLLLQGVAYVRGLIPSYSPNSLMQALGEYIDNLDDGFIVRSMYQKALDFLEQEQPITSWLPATAAGIRMLDCSNSTLTNDLQLIADGTGILVLNQATDAGMIAYVFERGDVEWLETSFEQPGRTTLRMKPGTVCGVPRELQALQLALDLDALAPYLWVETYLKSLWKVV